MRRILISSAKIGGFLALWAALVAAVTMTAVLVGGENFYADLGWRVWIEVGAAAATIAALCGMAFLVDKRGAATLGFSPPRRMIDLLMGTILGAVIFAAPLGVLLLSGGARFAPDLSGFSASALGVGVLLCFFNVVTQEGLVRSYIFQELWSKYGAPIAIAVTTLLFVALHAAPITQGGAQGLIAGANVLLASVLLGLAYVRSGALWLPIGIHLGWNALQGPVLGINVTGADLAMGSWRVFEFPGEPLLTGGAMGVEGGLVGLIGPALGIAAIALLVKPKRGPSAPAETR